ncbi:hypothetical protein Mcup_1076 [Metallosphaera cuprina Ar-4]|uniref:Uncharacterized protein n=1 Tax=Metallosphaera cuprina (strain Ar-4) TaxID=1006006 RepID=F4G2Y3_METCR|nr:hypothetical protein Mcup_1076 [Metallosphaera cuprina Ar-4]
MELKDENSSQVLYHIMPVVESFMELKGPYPFKSSSVRSSVCRILHGVESL